MTCQAGKEFDGLNTSKLENGCVGGTWGVAWDKDCVGKRIKAN